MKIDRSAYLKWIDSKHDHVKQLDFSLINQCVVTSRAASGEVHGFSVFEPRDFDTSFATKLNQRASRPEFKDYQFEVIVPKFLEHRVEKIFESATPVPIKVTYSAFVNIKYLNNSFRIRDRMRVVNVDDSPVILKLLQKSFSEMGFIDVVGQCSNPMQAVELILQKNPDLVTMDIQMPGKTGVEIIQNLFSQKVFPVIVLSSLSLEAGSLVFAALNAGAFDYLPKPRLEELPVFKEDLLTKCLSAVEGRNVSVSRQTQPKAPKITVEASTIDSNLLWVIGASTGGTQAITQIFTSMTTHIPPTLIVQHMPPVFSRAFADSLNNLCPFKVSEAQDGETVEPDHVYIARGAMQMGVEQRQGNLVLILKDAPPVNRFKPSVDYLFHQVAQLKGFKVVAAILTGMGKDGAKGLLELRDSGAATIGQDEASSAVYGMPRVAFELGAVSVVAPLDTIAHEFMKQSLKAPDMSSLRK